MTENCSRPLDVLLIAYKVQSGLGSEDGSGYNVARRIVSAGHRVTLISRCNNIDLLSQDASFSSAKLVGVDVPSWLSWWKRGQRGIIPYYYLWQIVVGRKVADLLRTQDFDIVHQFNFHTDWAPHFIPGKAVVVWGPICHQPIVPMGFASRGRARHLMKEAAKLGLKSGFWWIDPALRAAIRRTDLILYANDDIAPPYRRSSRLARQTFAGGGAARMTLPPRCRERFTLLHVGRQVPIKGAVPALEAFIQFCKSHSEVPARLVFVGDGPMHNDLRRAASEAPVGGVEFRKSVPFEKMPDVYAEADALLYPSLGNQDTVVAEALAAGLPVVCLEGTGTALMAGPAGVSVSRSPRDLAGELARLIAMLQSEWMSEPEQYERRRKCALGRSDASFNWDAITEAIIVHYRDLVQ